jgi:hypothetical protein
MAVMLFLRPRSGFNRPTCDALRGDSMATTHDPINSSGCGAMVNYLVYALLFLVLVYVIYSLLSRIVP